MLVRRKDLCFAFRARGGLRYCVNGLTILAPEAEAPRVLRLDALSSCSRFKQKSLSELPSAAEFSNFSERSGSESHGGRHRNAPFCSCRASAPTIPVLIPSAHTQPNRRLLRPGRLNRIEGCSSSANWPPASAVSYFTVYRCASAPVIVGIFAGWTTRSRSSVARVGSLTLRTMPMSCNARIVNQVRSSSNQRMPCRAEDGKA